MIRRARILVGLVLFALAGYYAGKAARSRPEPTRTAFVVPAPVLDRLRRGEPCPLCGHDGADHDPDLGCTALGHVPFTPWWEREPCPCRRLGCLCPPAAG